ncbi:MAG TPA: hypothetical protein VJW76_05245, partial [Verrucomicrobiae bacterium]|nr:hypothetical protein [Verrucomicrobiae bacterium]
PPSGPRADKVPVLGDLPLVGPLFRSASTTNSLHVVTSPKASQEPKLITQFFRINPQSFLEALRRQMPDTGSTNMDMVRRFFEGAGVNPNPPNMVFFKDRTGILMVRATAEELDLVQKAIAALNIAPPQSPAESKSVEVGPNDTKKLGFDWFLGNTLLSNGQLGSQGGTAPPQEDKTKPVSSPTPLETRSFRVDPHRLRESLQKQLAGDLSTNVVESVRRFFEGAGVNVFSPNTIYYDERTGLLMVRATKEEFETVEKALAILNYSPAQITIESRLMEMPTDTAGILGLDLPPPNSTTNTWKRVLTAAQMQALLRAAEQSSAMGILIAPKILPAPKVTTLSGRQTQIQVMDNGMTTRIKPQALAQPGVQPTNGATSPFTMSAIPPGSVLNLVPEVDSDGYTIHVTASISVMRARGEGKHAHLPLPILLIRQMQAEADVYNGQTLVLGNPNGESVTERTPEESEKQLLVFITPTIIDPAGNPIHPPGKEPFSTDKVPPQSR